MFFPPQVTEDESSDPKTISPPATSALLAPASKPPPVDTELGDHGTTSTDETGTW